MKKLFLGAALFLLSFDISKAFCLEISPKEVVTKYFTEDLRGARLSSNTYDVVKPLVVWEHEPGWDYMYVVNGAKILYENKINDKETSIGVTYNVLGQSGGDDKFTLLNLTELVEFILVKKDDKWKISKPIIPPHISPPAFLKHIEDLIHIEENVNKDRTMKLKEFEERFKTWLQSSGKKEN